MRGAVGQRHQTLQAGRRVQLKEAAANGYERLWLASHQGERISHGIDLVSCLWTAQSHRTQWLSHDGGRADRLEKGRLLLRRIDEGIARDEDCCRARVLTKGCREVPPSQPLVIWVLNDPDNRDD